MGTVYNSKATEFFLRPKELISKSHETSLLPIQSDLAPVSCHLNTNLSNFCASSHVYHHYHILCLPGTLKKSYLSLPRFSTISQSDLSNMQI